MDPAPARTLVGGRGLAGAAFGHLTEAFMALPFEALAPVKTLLKRYLSAGPWTEADDDALAGAAGAGEGWWERDLDADLRLAFGWRDGRFRIDVRSTAAPAPSPAAGEQAPAPGPLDGTFDGPVVPEATPNPRTIRFGFAAPAGAGPSRWYESAAAAAGDPPAARLFAEFDRVANVLVGPGFVAVGVRRPGDWEALLAPVLAVVTEEFAGAADTPASPSGAAGGPVWLAGGGAPPHTGGAGEGRPPTRLERAWQDLGALRPAGAADLARVVAAAAGPDPARRQVAANLLREGDPAAARTAWSALVHDPVRPVRRAAVDAMVDAGREELRPLLEQALADADAWVRWKALRGLVELGPAPSRTAIAGAAEDPDFRVRLEAAGALRHP